MHGSRRTSEYCWLKRTSLLCISKIAAQNGLSLSTRAARKRARDTPRCMPSPQRLLSRNFWNAVADSVHRFQPTSVDIFCCQDSGAALTHPQYPSVYIKP